MKCEVSSFWNWLEVRHLNLSSSWFHNLGPGMNQLEFAIEQRLKVLQRRLVVWWQFVCYSNRHTRICIKQWKEDISHAVSKTRPPSLLTADPVLDELSFEIRLKRHTTKGSWSAKYRSRAHIEQDKVNYFIESFN